MADSGCETVYFWKNVPLTGYFIETSTPPSWLKGETRKDYFSDLQTLVAKLIIFLKTHTFKAK